MKIKATWVVAFIASARSIQATRASEPTTVLGVGYMDCSQFSKAASDPDTTMRRVALMHSCGSKAISQRET